jgi:hypothetical protein
MVRMFAYASPQVDIIAQKPTTIAASVFSYFNIRYLMLHGTGGALSYHYLQKVAEAAAGGTPPERQIAALTYSDTFRASGLLRAMGPLKPIPAGSVLAYKVAPPDDPLPFLGIGAGWSPVTNSPDGVERRILGAAEVLIYSARPRDIILTLELTSPAPGRLAISVNGQEQAILELRGGQERHEVALRIASGATPVRLHASDMEIAVRALGIDGD